MPRRPDHLVSRDAPCGRSPRHNQRSAVDVVPGVGIAGMFKRLETWAAQSPDRTRLLMITLCIGVGIAAVVLILLLAWLALYLLAPQA